MKFNFNVSMDLEISEHELHALADIAEKADQTATKHNEQTDTNSQLVNLRNDINKLVALAENSQKQ